MKQKGRIFSWISRMRHSRGFGVHSPYAFMLIHDLIESRYAYYSDDSLEEILRRVPEYKHDNRILFRIAARMQPDHIRIYGAGNPAAEEAVRLSRPKIKNSGEHGLIYISSPGFDKEFLKYSRIPDQIILARKLKPESLAFIEENINYGLLLYSPRLTLFIARKEMAFLSYDIRL